MDNLTKLAMSRMKTAAAGAQNTTPTSGAMGSSGVAGTKLNSAQMSLLQGGFYGNTVPAIIRNSTRPSGQQVVKVDNIEKYGQFIQISDLISDANRVSVPSIINKSHPILCKSLGSAPDTPQPDPAVCIEKLRADADKVDTSNDIEASLDSFKISRTSAGDSNNNTSQALGPGPNNNVSVPATPHIFPSSSVSLGNPASRGNSITINNTLLRNIAPKQDMPRPKTPSSSIVVSSGFAPRNTSSPRNSTSPRKPPVPGLKPIKPIPGLKAIGPLAANPVVPSVSPRPSKRLTEEVDITLSPVKSGVFSPELSHLNSSGKLFDSLYVIYRLLTNRY